MLKINHAILQAFDFEGGSEYLSDRELDLSQRQTRSYVQRQMRKISSSADSEHGSFEGDNPFADDLAGYLRGTQSFLEISRSLGDWFFERLRTSDDTEQADLLICDFSDEAKAASGGDPAADASAGDRGEGPVDAGSQQGSRGSSAEAAARDAEDEVLDAAFEARQTRYFAAVLLPRRKSFAHELTAFDGAAANELIRTDGVLPNPSQKIESYLCINTETLAIDFADKKRAIGSQQLRLIPDMLLHCTATPSAHEAIDKVSLIVEDLAQEYGLTPAVEVSRVKAEIARDADRYEEVRPQEVAERVWGEDHPELQERFEERAREQELPEEVPVRRAAGRRMAKTHRIRTDTGIDISFPTEYSSDDSYIAFDQQPDGTISITIKHVGKIENR